ncbi:MAG: DinB family protein [Armatimonas sp.]
MASETTSLLTVFQGWDGYQQSLVAAIRPLTAEQLSFRLTPEQRSVGEIAAHIAFGRLDWFSRMGAPGTAELVEKAAPYWKPWGPVSEAINDNGLEIIHWLEATWSVIEANLTRWTVEDLNWTYRQPYGGKAYLVSCQWVIWRIMAHDIHHGGQLSTILMAQGIEIPELGDNGGHIIEVPLEKE